MPRLIAAPGRTSSLALVLCALACLAGCSRPDEAAQDPALAARQDSIRLDSLAQRRRAYEATRAEACQDVYKRENNKYSNVVTWKYDRDVDGCYVIYNYAPPRTEAECDSMYPPSEPTFFQQRSLCHEGKYRTRF
ncbi:MAG: hypothetical protein FIB01_13130 [Gemmatimonadetes bacterium]|nr:hypothetical protein [Gemmatimonadota bacterium]